MLQITNDLVMRPSQGSR